MSDTSFAGAAHERETIVNSSLRPEGTTKPRRSEHRRGFFFSLLGEVWGQPIPGYYA